MIKYIAHYDCLDKLQERNYFLSCVNKVSYILKILSSQGQEVEVLSASNSLIKKSLHKQTIQLYDNVKLKLFHGFKRGSVLRNKISTFMFKIMFFIHLLFNLHKDDTVIVYHSLAYFKQIAFLKKIKKFRLILEIEEIYADVIGNARKKQKEIKFFQLADAYLFPTNLLNDTINLQNKPYVIIHGTYNVEKDYGEKFNDGRVHCVYAGTFDSRKGGVAAAAAAAQFLNEKYHVHIIGFGSKKDEELLKNQIDEISKKTKCKITFEGLKSGEDYNRFIQKCDIGLSTQNPDASFNDTSFPSKILSYMANGLRVVSIRIPAITTSAINDYMYYYDEQTPQKIAEEIKNVDLHDEYDGRDVIKKLNVAFFENLKKILNNVSN